MEKPKLTIPPKKYVGESTVVSLRLAKDMVNEFDKIAKKTGRTRNEVITMSLEFALDSLDSEEKENKK